MITNETATSIAYAYREIDTAEKLLAEITDTMRERRVGDPPDIRDAFGRRQEGLQLGVPSGSNGHRLFNVPWSLAKPVIEAHIASQKAIVAALCDKARSELTVRRNIDLAGAGL
jgi:hypothetical protein